MPKAYSYLRISTSTQSLGGGIARQLEKSREYAARHGLDLDEAPLQDIGLSAYRSRNSKEGALADFLAAVDAGQIERGSTLIVESLDRVSRDKIFSAMKLFIDIIGRGIRLVTLINEQVYSEESVNDNWASLILSLGEMARAHEESKTKSVRISANWERKRREALADGKPMTKICPAWLRVVDGKYELIPDRAEIVRQIFASVQAGHGKYLIARRLNETGIPNFSGRGTGWHPSYVQKILDNPATFGRQEFGRRENGKRVMTGEYADDIFPAVIDAATFYACRPVRGARTGGNRGRTYANLMSGLVYCYHCGGHVQYSWKRRKRPNHNDYAFLQCDNARRSAGCTRRECYSYQGIEDAILEAVGEISLDHSGKAIASAEEIAALEGKLAATSSALNNLLAAIEAGTAPPTLARRITELDADQDAMRKRLADLRSVQGAVTAESEVQRLEELKSLRARMGELTGQDLYDLRARLADNVRKVISRVTLGEHWASFSVELRDGTKGYKIMNPGGLKTRSGRRSKNAVRSDLTV